MLFITITLLPGCGEDGVQPVVQNATLAAPQPTGLESDLEGDAGQIYTGDLDALRQKGRLRILIPANIGGVFYLPREGWPVDEQHRAAERFARSQGLQPELVPVEGLAQMIPALLAGRGDIIAANLTVTETRRERIAFSLPLTHVRQQVLVTSTRDDIQGDRDLAGRRVMVDPSSVFWERLTQLREKYPALELIARPAEMSDEEELDAVADGRVDATVRDSNVAGMYLGYRDDLKVAFELPGNDAIAWGIRRESPQLRAALDQFLHLELPVDGRNARHTDDFDGIKRRRVLRVLLPNNAASYFLYRGELHGFEYELAKAFADAHQLRLEVIVPDTHEQLLDWLRNGRGDVAAGFLEPSAALKARGLAFSRNYHYAARHLVMSVDGEQGDRQTLAGLTITVRRSSPYWSDLVKLQRGGAAFELIAAAEDIETEELIARVAIGDIEATVADGHLLDIELARGLPVRSAMKLSEERGHSVAVRDQNQKLLAALDDFIKAQYRGLVYNVLYKKYFTNPRQVRNLAAGRLGGDNGEGLSPYDEITRRYADEYGFDWRLITAQMYQESRFDPAAKSFAGAEGLLQVMPRTAKFMGFGDISGPEEGIHAGVKYLQWVRDRFEPTLPFNERMWFTLAAYNAGHGHVQDARRLARQKGWDGDRWFEHTEKAMLLLSKDRYAKKARYGYVRGIEPVSYVRNIRRRYRAYVDIATRRLSQKSAGGSRDIAAVGSGTGAAKAHARPSHSTSAPGLGAVDRGTVPADP
ncbi:MAG: transporter substrate-binding domain-containing protein [Chromatiaceae bacterium]|jgi:membrane-bound lytic murein transglycosylase F